MFRSNLTLPFRNWIGRWCSVAALAACLGLAGCTSLDLRGRTLPESDLSGWAQQMRGPERSTPPTAWTNMGRQIEKGLGVQ